MKVMHAIVGPTTKVVFSHAKWTTRSVNGYFNSDESTLHVELILSLSYLSPAFSSRLSRLTKIQQG